MGLHVPGFSGMLQQQYLESKEEACITMNGEARVSFSRNVFHLRTSPLAASTSSLRAK